MSVLQEAALHYPHGDLLPRRGAAFEVRPGVHWLRMPLPFALDHINLWLLRDATAGCGDGWTIVDCGIDDSATREAWLAVFDKELGGVPVHRVLCTHMHPDHVGLAHWLTAHWRCPLWMSATDWQAARAACEDTAGSTAQALGALYARHGLPDAAAAEPLRHRRSGYRQLVPAVPQHYRRLLDGDSVSIGGVAWRCIVGYGHAPEHIALYSAALGVLISGDMVLPRISTNVSVHDSEPEGDPLARYLHSLGAYGDLPADTLVLPSHGKPFVGLHTRIAQLRSHHRDRLGETLDVCRERPYSAADLLPVMFRRPLDAHQIRFAMGEALAHLNWLWHRGLVTCEPQADGVLRFSAVPGASLEGRQDLVA